MSKYRHEYKYMIDAYQEQVLQVKLDGLLQKDRYIGKNGYYTIHSMYFDTYDNACYYENENGTEPRAKYRMRYYNDDIGHVRLEKKSKCHGMTLKQACCLNAEECRCLLEGRIPYTVDEAEEMKMQLFTELRIKKMIPKIIISYERVPYVYEVGNVRVTLDKNIVASDELTSFLNSTYRKRPILQKGMSVLEVKWDEVLPQYIKRGIGIEYLQWTAFSKYYLGRKYNINGGLK